MMLLHYPKQFVHRPSIVGEFDASRTHLFHLFTTSARVQYPQIETVITKKIRVKETDFSVNVVSIIQGYISRTTTTSVTSLAHVNSVSIDTHLHPNYYQC